MTILRSGGYMISAFNLYQRRLVGAGWQFYWMSQAPPRLDALNIRL